MECKDILKHDSHAPSSIYRIHPHGSGKLRFEVYCDMTTDGGGWTVGFKQLENSTVINNIYICNRNSFFLTVCSDTHLTIMHCMPRVDISARVFNLFSS